MSAAEIRKAKEQDIPRIAEILVFGKRTAYRSIFRNDAASFRELLVEKVMQEYRNNPALLAETVVYDDGIVKGLCRRSRVTEGEQADEFEILDFYVEPFFKGMGVGGRLLEHIIEECRREKGGRLSLWVIKKNTPARKFYENCGFVPDKIERTVEGTKIKELHYFLKINGNKMECGQKTDKTSEQESTELLMNLDRLHTTRLGMERIRKNLGLTEDEDAVDWCRRKIRAADMIKRQGKNWYVTVAEGRITVNANSYTLITAHKA